MQSVGDMAAALRTANHAFVPHLREIFCAQTCQAPGLGAGFPSKMSKGSLRFWTGGLGATIKTMPRFLRKMFIILVYLFHLLEALKRCTIFCTKRVLEKHSLESTKSYTMQALEKHDLEHKKLRANGPL